MQGAHLLSTIVVLALASFLATATDPGPLQDFCVAVNDIKTGCKYIYGFFCFLLIAELLIVIVLKAYKTCAYIHTYIYI